MISEEKCVILYNSPSYRSARAIVASRDLLAPSRPL